MILYWENDFIFLKTVRILFVELIKFTFPFLLFEVCLINRIKFWNVQKSICRSLFLHDYILRYSIWMILVFHWMIHIIDCYLCLRIFIAYFTDKLFWTIQDFLRVNALNMKMKFAFGTHFYTWLFSCCFTHFALVKNNFLSFLLRWFNFILIFLFLRFDFSLFFWSVFFLYNQVWIFLNIVLELDMIFHTLRVSWLNNLDDFLFMVI